MPNKWHSVVQRIVQVEELKDDGHSSAASLSDMDEAHSDREDADRSSKPCAPFVPPSDELKEKIINQVNLLKLFMLPKSRVA